MNCVLERTDCKVMNIMQSCNRMEYESQMGLYLLDIEHGYGAILLKLPFRCPLWRDLCTKLLAFDSQYPKSIIIIIIIKIIRK